AAPRAWERAPASGEPCDPSQARRRARPRAQAREQATTDGSAIGPSPRSFFLGLGVGEANHIEQNVDLGFRARRRFEATKRVERGDPQVLHYQIGLLSLERVEDFL